MIEHVVRLWMRQKQSIWFLWRGKVIVVDEKEKRSGTGTPPGSTGRCKAESRDP